MTDKVKPKNKSTTEELLRRKLNKRETSHNFLIYSNKPDSEVKQIESKGIINQTENQIKEGITVEQPQDIVLENQNGVNSAHVEMVTELEQEKIQDVNHQIIGKKEPHEVLTVKKRSLPKTFKRVQPKKSDRYTPKTFRVDKEVLEIFEKYMNIEHGDYQKIINLSLINAILSDELVSKKLLNKSIADYNRLIELEEEYQSL